MPADYDNIYDYPFSVVREHPSSIDRSAGNAVTDGQTITVGETLGPKQAVYLHYPADVQIIAPDGSTLYEGRLGTSTTFTPSMPGTYRVVGDRGEISTFEVEPGAGNSEEDTVGNPGDWTNNAPDGPSAHDRAVSAPGVVASDNEASTPQGSVCNCGRTSTSA